jgi:uncharacterized protein (DUF169 family)
MEDFEFLEKRFGGWWCGVKFGREAGGDNRPVSHPMRFCEAVAASRTGQLILTPKLMICPGGARSLGWNNDEKTMTRIMAEKAGLDMRVARDLIRDTPRMSTARDAITVGTYESPDIVISYAQPDVVMKLLREWQALNGGSLAMRASGFMSVCGAVAARAFLTRRICISFGCPDARQYGGIGRDRLVIGLSMRQVARLRRGARRASAKAVVSRAPSLG